MRILVCGDREWTDREAIARQLRCLKLAFHEGWTGALYYEDLLDHRTGESPPLVLIHGAARGADRIAGEEGTKLGFEVLPYPADWQNLGRAAGVIRNQVMLDDGRPDLVLAFHPNLAESKGTADMVRRVRSAGIPTEVFPS